jgi:hypothetical protein
MIIIVRRKVEHAIRYNPNQITELCVQNVDRSIKPGVKDHRKYTFEDF